MGSLNSNKLNELTAKEWTRLSASVIFISSKKKLLKRISRIYSKKQSNIVYFSYKDKPKWKQKVLFSRNFYSEFSYDLDYQLAILDLQNIDSIVKFKEANLWIINSIKIILELLDEKNYLIVIVNNFSDPKEKINYFPMHYFIVQNLEAINLIHTDLWSVSNDKKDSDYTTTFLLCFKKSKHGIYERQEIKLQNFIHKNRISIVSTTPYPKVISGFSSTREPEYIKHGATFPQSLIEYFINIFTKKNDLILDIFSGVGLALFAARNLGRNAIGIELNPVYVKWTKQLEKRKFGNLMNYISDKTDNQIPIKLINDDNRNLLTHVKRNSIKLMITSPPYFNILHKVVEEAEKRGSESVFRRRVMSSEMNIKSLDGFFKKKKISDIALQGQNQEFQNKISSTLIPQPYSGDERDLGNIKSYQEFLQEINLLNTLVLDVLKPGGYAIWIIRDFRDMKNNRPYINFHSDLMIIAIRVGFIFLDLIVWNQNRERKLIHLGGGSSYYNSMTMSFIVVLQKPTTNKE